MPRIPRLNLAEVRGRIETYVWERREICVTIMDRPRCLYCSLYNITILHFFYRNPGIKPNNGIYDPPYHTFPTSPPVSSIHFSLYHLLQDQLSLNSQLGLDTTLSNPPSTPRFPSIISLTLHLHPLLSKNHAKPHVAKYHTQVNLPNTRPSDNSKNNPPPPLQTKL